MATLRAKDIRKLTERDLEKKMDELRLELAKERANISIGASVTSPGKIRDTKRTIARMLTIKKEKARGGSQKNE
jgi:large subunit ribosomal protein L29